MASVNVHCPRCDPALVYRHGQEPKGQERFRCHECRCLFQLTDIYQARKPGVKEIIVDMAFNGAGVRDMVRARKVGINTVIRTLKNSPRSERQSPCGMYPQGALCQLRNTAQVQSGK